MLRSIHQEIFWLHRTLTISTIFASSGVLFVAVDGAKAASIQGGPSRLQPLLWVCGAASSMQMQAEGGHTSRGPDNTSCSPPYTDPDGADSQGVLGYRPPVGQGGTGGDRRSRQA